jgi:hypothetical protein
MWVLVLVNNGEKKRGSRHFRLVDEYVGVVFKNGFDRLKVPVSTLREALFWAEENDVLYSGLLHRRDHPAHCHRAVQWDGTVLVQRQSRDYLWTLSSALRIGRSLKKKKSYLSMRATGNPNFGAVTCVDGP